MTTLLLALSLLGAPRNNLGDIEPPGFSNLAGDLQLHLNDDVQLTFGNTSAAPDVWFDNNGTSMCFTSTSVDGGGTDGNIWCYTLGGNLIAFGAFTSSHALTSGIGVAGDLEVNGVLYADGDIRLDTGDTRILDAGNGAAIQLRNVSQTPDTTFIGLSDASRSIIIAEYTDRNTDLGHAQPTNPTVFIHSIDVTDIGQYSSVAWNKFGFAGHGGHGAVTKSFAYGDMTDGGGASGTIDFDESIPDGAVVQQTICHTLTGFTGDVSATITVGDGTDVDRYNTGTPSVFTTNASGVDLGVPSGTKWHDDTKTPRVTITSNADFTNVSAGQLTCAVFYWAP